MNELQALRDAVIANLDEGYDLCYVDQGDKLMSDQIDAVVAGDWESLWESNEEWYSDNRRHGAEYHAEEETKDVIRSWAIRDQRDYDDLYEEFKDTEEWDEVILAIQDRDTSDPYRDLAKRSGRVLMRQVIAGEDDAISFRRPTPTEVIAWLKEYAEPGTVLKRNKHNLDVVRATLNETSPEHGYVMGMIVYAADVSDLYDLGDVEYVDIVNPYLYLGNYYQGDGFCSEEPLDATFRVKRKDLRTDKGAPGYGWDEVAGVVTSYYEADIKPVKQQEEGAA